MPQREDQGKNLLRMLQAAQPAPAPPDARQGHSDEANASEYPSHSYPVPATDVRSAAAGEPQYPHPASAAAPDHSSFLLPRPGTLASTPVRSAGADVRMLHQRSPQQLAPEPAPLQPNRQQHGQHQQQQYRLQHQQSYQNQAEQQGTASPPPQFTPRSGSIAAEQERFLKNVLAIGGDNGNNSNSGPPPSSAPFSPPSQRQQQRTAVVPQTPPPPASTPTRPPPPVTPSAATETPRPHSGRVRNNSVSNQGKGGGGGRDSRGRGGRTPQQGVSGGREGRKGRGRGGGGGGRGGPTAPASASKYAWSAFQNSPDPKSIPIPSLRHFNLDVSPGEESAGPEVGLSSLDWRESIQQPPPPPQEQVQGSGSEGVAGYDGSVAGGALSTPHPSGAPGVARTDAAASNGNKDNNNRSSAKKAEEDIKRMLRLG